MKQKSKYWWIILLRGILFLLLAFYVFSNPIDSLVGLAIYIGISLMISGVLLIFTSLASKNINGDWGWQLAEGFFDILFSLVLLSSPGITAATLPFVVGIWVMVYGIILFVGAFQSKSSGGEFSWFSLFGGILTVILGYLITNNLFVGAMALTYWIGFGFLISGILNLNIGLKLKS